jgi:hypothetical protein
LRNLHRPLTPLVAIFAIVHAVPPAASMFFSKN